MSTENEVNVPALGDESEVVEGISDSVVEDSLEIKIDVLESEELDVPEDLPDTESVEPVEAIEGEEARLRGALDQAEVTFASTRQSVDDLRRQQARLQARQERTSTGLDDITSEIDEYRDAQEGLRTWVSNRSRSFAWRLLTTLKNQSNTLDSEYEQLREVTEQPIAVISETPSALQDRFMKRVFFALIMAFIVFIVVTSLKNNYPQLENWQSWANPFTWPLWVLALVIVGAYIVTWTLLVISYYKANSQRRHRLAVAQEYVTFLAKTTESIRVERQRLNTLHSQVPEYLKYLSEVLHRPWVPPVLRKGATTRAGVADHSLTVTAEEIVFDSSRPESDYLPAFMRLAEVPELTGGEKEQALVRDAIQAVLEPGWRYSALARLLVQVERALSLPADSLAPARLDRDPRLRETVVEALQTTTARSEAGREMLKSLARQIQVSVMDTIHPPVKNIAPDPLADLDLDTDFIDGTNRTLVEWDDFLSENLGDPGTWSPAAFSPLGRQSIPAVKSQAYGAERLGTRADSNVDYRSIVERTARPIEMSVRIDLTQSPLDPSLFAVFDGYVSRKSESDSGLIDLEVNQENVETEDEVEHL